jgi:hypothetical protein
MKKIILLLGGLVLGVASFAQFSFGVQATGAVGLATVKSKYDLDFKKDAAIVPGGGIVVQLDLGSRLALRSGVNFQQQGITVKHAEDEFGSVSSKLRLNYLQVPVHALYKFTTGFAQVYAGVGGYAGYGISGTIKNTLWFYTPDGGYTFVEKLKAFKKSEEDGGDLQKGDFGLSGLVGVKLANGLFVQAGYQHGLKNIDRDKENTYRNQGAQLTVGYFFR